MYKKHKFRLSLRWDEKRQGTASAVPSNQK
jgi:hypothetical protein